MAESVQRRIQKVLLVDDWDVWLSQWARDCRSMQKVPIRAKSRAEAVLVAQRERPEAAVVDLFLSPPDHGIDIVKDLKALDPSMAVIVVSAAINVDLAMLAVKAGADECFSKAVRCRQMLAAVETGQRPEPSSEYPTLDEVEWEHISRVLNDHKGNVTHTAKALQMPRYSLQRKIARRSARALRSTTTSKPR
jgi:two-component system response regulator RegA